MSGPPDDLRRGGTQQSIETALAVRPDADDVVITGTGVAQDLCHRVLALDSDRSGGDAPIGEGCDHRIRS